MLILAYLIWEMREAEEPKLRVKKSKEKITMNNFFFFWSSIRSTVHTQADGRSGNSVRTIPGINGLMTSALPLSLQTMRIA